MNPNEVISQVLFAVLIGTALAGVFLLTAPRTMNGNGAIPDGCTVLTHIKEVYFGPGEHPVCFIPGAAIPR